MKHFYILLLALFVSGSTFSQINENFDSGLSNSYSTGNAILASGTWTIKDVIQESSSNSRSGFAARINDDKTGAHITTPNLNGAGTITFWYRELNSGGGTFNLQIATNGGSYTTIDSQVYSGQTYSEYSFDINSASANLTVRILSDDNSGHLIIDDLQITSYSSGPTPTIILSETTLSGFNYVESNGPSTAQSFDVSGTDLDNTDVIITAPTDFEVSDAENGTYGSSITLSAFDGTTDELWVRLADGKAIGNYSGDITTSGGGDTTPPTLSLSGEVTAAPPTNDNCSNAIALTVNNSCSSSSYSNANGTNSGTLPDPGCSIYSGADVWFSIEVPTSGNLDIETTADGITDGAMALYSGTCGALTLIECDDDDGAGFMPLISVTGLVPESTVYVLFWAYDGAEEGSFNICAVDPIVPPTITLSETSLTGFTYEEGSGPSDELTFTAEGSSLTTDITITAPTNFEISTTSGSGFASSLMLTPTDGTVSTTTIYVRLASTLDIDTYNGTLSATSTGATQQDINLSGEVTAVSCASSTTTFPFNGVSGSTNLDHDNSGSNPSGSNGESCGNNYRIYYDSQPSTDGSGNYLRSNTIDGLIESADWGGTGKFETFSIDVSGETSVDIETFGNTTNSGFNTNSEQFQWWYKLDGGAETNLGSAFGDGTPYTGSLAIAPTTINVTGVNSLKVGFTFNMNGGSDGFEDVDLTVTKTPTTYTYNGTWSPSTPIGNSTVNDFIVIASGNISIDADITCSSFTVNAGAGVTIDSGVTVTVNDVTDGFTLESTSSSFASLILDGSISGTVNYKRYANSYTNNSTFDDNDLIAPPLAVTQFSDFATANSGSLLASGSLRAFAPFDKGTGTYINYNNTDMTPLNPGTGYRVATIPTSDQILTFTGTPVSSDLTGASGINIEDNGPQFADWNLIGNPYPSYIDLEAFLTHEVSTATSGERNIDLLEGLSGVYGYDGNSNDGWTVITLANDAGELLAPGQGFFVAADGTDVAAHNIEFTKDMRRTGTADDFIAFNDSNSLTYLELKAYTVNNAYHTEFYFNPNASLGLDPGYDAVVFGGNAPSTFALYSHLVQDNAGSPFALQALGSNDVSNVTIPLGINANAGEQLTFTIHEMQIPDTVNVYLEDTVENTITLLNTSDYIMTPSSQLTGTGRFYITFTNTTLSTLEETLDIVDIYANNTNRTVVVSGELDANTSATLFDLQGRVVETATLDASKLTNTINVNHLRTGVYIVQLTNASGSKTSKIILK
ncbi:MAG: T9SS type A sorting domain-containing protein [Winogradskyella sp.]|uniref:T9SS type A sorting domain-containing protein n=1 Tax=Winogradskyella sp. TaxID=1883156 RepID=UPI0025F09D02|nr:T9SS type A sorting domain-containing protein [Winogradskyella sp.]NRB60111.1 T9SS type A sorting domain-containing protein [Winogradskyella sp.]